MERMPMCQLLLLAACVLGLVATAAGQATCGQTLGGTCCPGAKLGSFCGPGCSGGCPGYCKASSTTAPLLKCAPCGMIGKKCCPGAKLFSPCATSCGGGGCNSRGTCIGSGSGPALTCDKCGQDYGKPCCPGQPANSPCKLSATNSAVAIGYCTPKTGICKSCNLVGGPCCPGAKPGSTCDFFNKCVGTGTGLQLTCMASGG